MGRHTGRPALAPRPQRRCIIRLVARFRRATAAIRSGVGTRRGLWGVARAVRLITAFIVGVIVIGILLVLLEANRANELVDLVLDVGGFFVEPFDNIFKLVSRKGNVFVNWGIGALIYALIGALIIRALARR